MPLGPRFLERYDGVYPNQGVGAEMIAERWGFSRTQLDEFALASHEKAAKAQADGAFDEEIAPVTTPDGTVVGADEGIRPGGTLEKLALAEDPVQGGRRHHRGQRQPDLRRRGGAAGDHQREGPRARADPAGADPHRGDGRRRPGDHADRADPRDPEGAAAVRALDRRHRHVRGQRGVRAGPVAWLAEIGADPATGSTRRAARSPSATRWAAPAPAS